MVYRAILWKFRPHKKWATLQRVEADQDAAGRLREARNSNQQHRLTVHPTVDATSKLRRVSGEHNVRTHLDYEWVGARVRVAAERVRGSRLYYLYYRSVLICLLFRVALLHEIAAGLLYKKINTE